LHLAINNKIVFISNKLKFHANNILLIIPFDYCLKVK
jgi:hypothetical protein